MFNPSDRPRLFGLPPGVDFPQALKDGLLTRMGIYPPEALARVEIFVNTRRMQRRLKSLFDAGPARLLPRIRLVTDLADDTRFSDIPPAASALRRRLELTQLVGKLLDQQPDLAPRSALYDLADSLAALMDEMQGEGVAPEVIRKLDVSDVSGHWQRNLHFVNLVERYFGADSGHDPDAEARQRLVIDRLEQEWAVAPPKHPVLVAGSTGSRGATAAFMRAVARLPQGAVVLPGVDFDMPADVWDKLNGALAAEDHPQYRFAHLAQTLGMSSGEILPWDSSLIPPNPARNRMISLALRPAPVTDQWLAESQNLTDLQDATAKMTLIEAPSPRAEATAIALALRMAVETGRVAALITPDRTLTRQVTTALDRWGIVPDDSAGRPLPLSAPGRLLRHIAGLFGQRMTSDALLTVLKHPLTNTGSDDRGPHLLHTRELELKLRRYGPPFPTGSDLLAWAEKGDDERKAWALWLHDLMAGVERVGARSLVQHVEHHIQLSEALSAGPSGDGSGTLWLKAAGREARRWVEELRVEAKHGGALSAGDYASLFHSVLQRGDVREAVVAHPDVMIWGTLEARVQGAELTILAGLNEGTWPEPPKPDPWLNRAMRAKAGLLLPERRIGLSAHDFQQAVAADEVIISRSVRDAEAQTVPSRWINRLVNLLGGVSKNGEAALAGMRQRGAHLLSLAQHLEAPDQRVDPASRPSPQPPVETRPKEISITEVQTLIRDPFEVYAKRVLGLRPLDPLRHRPDPPLRGTIVHLVLEQFVKGGPVADLTTGVARLMKITDQVLEAEAAWPAARRMWRARMVKVAGWFVETELARQANGQPIALERKGALFFADLDTELRGKIDRIDRRPDGALVVYDYKTGNPPTPAQQDHFDKQLMLAAVMAEAGAIEGIEAAQVSEIAYVGLGSTPKFDPIALDIGQTGEILKDFRALVSAYQDRARGYTSRRAVDLLGYERSYNQLARYGEWDESDEPTPVEVG